MLPSVDFSMRAMRPWLYMDADALYSACSARVRAQQFDRVIRAPDSELERMWTQTFVAEVAARHADRGLVLHDTAALRLAALHSFRTRQATRRRVDAALLLLLQRDDEPWSAWRNAARADASGAADLAHYASAFAGGEPDVRCALDAATHFGLLLARRESAQEAQLCGCGAGLKTKAMTDRLLQLAVVGHDGLVPWDEVQLHAWQEQRVAAARYVLRRLPACWAAAVEANTTNVSTRANAEHTFDGQHASEPLRLILDSAVRMDEQLQRPAANCSTHIHS